MNNLVKTQVHISSLEIGMTVEYKGRLYTVGKENFFKTFYGWAFMGDSSSRTITRVQFAVPTAKGIVLR